MNDILRSFFADEKIEYFASAEIRENFIISSRRLPGWAKYVTAFLIPYNTGEDEKRNLSRYAVSKDYHLYVKELESKLKGKTNKEFCIFADTSPFDERRLAKALSLGFIGKNGLLINEKYGSFVFLGEIVTKEAVNIEGGEKSFRNECFDCGNCKEACPTKALSNKGACLSELTQKKKIDEKEKELIKNHNLVWGCDICQEVCPHNRAISLSNIDFFYKDRLYYVTSDDVEKMGEDEFLSRAYSWRGKNVILRNLSFKL
ncbi:MAG: epoxyqueuosine reductase [Ruminococcaceae bacterium]|nr:epoxyqueuosine reductase [Oscillospiraceae bacterium]